MNRLLPILLLFCCAGAQAAYNTINVSFTNRTFTGSNFVINGSTVTITSQPLNSVTWFKTNSPSMSATGLQRYIAQNYPFLFAKITNGTNVILAGNGLTFSTSGGYAVLTTNSGLTTNWHALMLPWDTSPFSTNRTNDADELIYGLNKYALTNAFKSDAQAMTNFVGKTNEVTLTRKTLTAPFINGGTNLATVVSNAPYGNVGNLTFSNGTAVALTATNTTILNLLNANGVFGSLSNGTLYHINATNAHSIHVTNLSALASTLYNPVLVNGSGIMVAPVFITTNRFVTITNGDLSPGLRFDNSDDGGESVISFNFAGATTPFTIDVSTNEFNITGDAGNFISLNRTNGAIRVGEETIPTIALGRFHAQGPIQAEAGITNSTFTGTNRWNGDLSFTRAAVTSLADGNNIAVPFGTNVFIYLSGSLSTPTLCGVLATARSGQTYDVLNKLGATLTISMDTVDPTPANRFDLYGGLAVTVPDEGWFRMKYDDAASRWRIESVYPATAIATNAQPASGTLTNLAGTGAITNESSLSVSNATLKPLFLHISNYVTKNFALEQGTNVVLYMTPTSIVINAASSGGGGSATTNFITASFGTLTVTNTLNGVKVYRAIISQGGTAAPTASVLENTLGSTITFGRSGFGRYWVTNSGTFTTNKTFVRLGGTFTDESSVVGVQMVHRVSDTLLRIEVGDYDGGGFNWRDGYFVEAPFEILVYP